MFLRTADGDLLCETLTGDSTATGSEGDFNPHRRTGHFLHATGSNTYVGVWTNPAKTTGYVSFGGSIDFNPCGRRGDKVRRPCHISGPRETLSTDAVI